MENPMKMDDLGVPQQVYGKSPCPTGISTTWWLIPRIVSGWNNPGDFNGISGGNVHLYLGWTNPLTKWDEPPSSHMGKKDFYGLSFPFCWRNTWKNTMRESNHTPFAKILIRQPRVETLESMIIHPAVIHPLEDILGRRCLLSFPSCFPTWRIPVLKGNRCHISGPLECSRRASLHK